MATRQETVDELLELLAGVGGVSARKMFGEYCVYLNGKPVALVCDDRLYVKLTDAGREIVPDAVAESPFPGAKPHLILPPEVWEVDILSRLLRTTFQALPRPKPRKKKS